MTQYFSSEEIFGNKNRLNDNIYYYNNALHEAGITLKIEIIESSHYNNKYY